MVSSSIGVLGLMIPLQQPPQYKPAIEGRLEIGNLQKLQKSLNLVGYK